mgnify:CR=1 FL=1
MSKEAQAQLEPSDLALDSCSLAVSSRAIGTQMGGGGGLTRIKRVTVAREGVHLDGRPVALERVVPSPALVWRHAAVSLTDQEYGRNLDGICASHRREGV